MRDVSPTQHGNATGATVSASARTKHSRPPRWRRTLSRSLTIPSRIDAHWGGNSMPTAHDILRFKGHAVHSVRANDTVLAALELMADHDIGAVIVLDGDAIVGILTERDYARKVALAGLSSKNSPVSAIMTSNVVTVTLQHSVDDCMTLMTERRVRHLPVLDGGRVAGVVSIGDLVKATIDEQEFTISQLKSYIAG
jgi:CBS domain-containing protein